MKLHSQAAQLIKFKTLSGNQAALLLLAADREHLLHISVTGMRLILWSVSVHVPWNTSMYVVEMTTDKWMPSFIYAWREKWVLVSWTRKPGLMMVTALGGVDKRVTLLEGWLWFSRPSKGLLMSDVRSTKWSRERKSDWYPDIRLVI